MEDNLKISNVEYISSHWLDLTQIRNLNLGDPTKLYKMTSNGRQPLTMHWSELSQFWNLTLGDQTKPGKYERGFAQPILFLR